MHALLNHPLWHKVQAERFRQKIFGRISAICLAMALFALADGLIAKMRSGVNELDILPGEQLAISGPAALKNPLASDLAARFTPTDAPLVFTLEGFFTGYWFGSGMWRGIVRAADNAETGLYELQIAFKGTGSQNTQKYLFHVYADAAAMQQGALSLFKRHLGLNAFILAAFFGSIGLICGLITYFYGHSLLKNLHKLGLAEIYWCDAQEIMCLAPKTLAPRSGSARMVLNEAGHVLGEARVISYEKGKLRLTLLDLAAVPPTTLICLRHPENTDKQA